MWSAIVIQSAMSMLLVMLCDASFITDFTISSVPVHWYLFPSFSLSPSATLSTASQKALASASSNPYVEARLIYVSRSGELVTVGDSFEAVAIHSCTASLWVLGPLRQWSIASSDLKPPGLLGAQGRLGPAGAIAGLGGVGRMERRVTFWLRWLRSGMRDRGGGRVSDRKNSMRDREG